MATVTTHDRRLTAAQRHGRPDTERVHVETDTIDGDAVCGVPMRVAPAVALAPPTRRG